MCFYVRVIVFFVPVFEGNDWHLKDEIGLQVCICLFFCVCFGVGFRCASVYRTQLAIGRRDWPSGLYMCVFLSVFRCLCSGACCARV